MAQAYGTAHERRRADHHDDPLPGRRVCLIDQRRPEQAAALPQTPEGVGQPGFLLQEGR